MPWRRAVLFLPAAVLVLSGIVRSLGGWSDFGGYVIAGSELLSGRFSADRSNTWPPFFSVLSIGMAALGQLPPVLARFLWAAFNALAYSRACALFWRAAGGARAAWWVAPAGALVIAPFLVQHLIFHQTYALIFALLVEAFLAAQAARDARAGVFVGVGGSLKVTPALLLPYFLFRKRWKLLGAAAGTALLCSLSLVPFLGWRGTVDAHRAWVARASTLRGTHGNRNQSIEAFVERLTTGEAKLEGAGIDPVVRLSEPRADRLGKALSWALLLLACFLLRKVEPVQALPALAAISVLAVPYCWRSQYIALGPLILVSLVRLSNQPDALSWILRAPFFLCIVQREPALIGARNFAFLEGAGVTCFVSLLLIADALRVRREPLLLPEGGLELLERHSPHDGHPVQPKRV
jgi:hypothetical protein